MLLKGGPRAWRYVGEGGRDPRIDLLRGLAVLAMVIDHLAGPSKLYLLTGGNRFYTSAAEGFIFLSGLTVGLVYRRTAEQKGLATAIRRLVERAWTLYVLAIGLTLVMLPISEILHLPWAAGIQEGTPLQIVWAIFSLHQTYYLVDVLTLYVLLMLAAPLALFLLCEERTWVLLGASWLIWAGFQLFPQQTDLPWTIAGNNLFYLSAWQALFFTAMAIGYHRERVEKAVPHSWRTALLVASGIGFVALLALYASQTAVLQAAVERLPTGLNWSVADLEDWLFAKGDVRPGRLLASAVIFGFLFQLTTVVWVPIRRGLGWLLLPLGQNALYSYSTHIVVALCLAMLSSLLQLTTGAWMNMTIQLSSIGLIWLAIRWRVLYPTPATRARWMSSVAPLAAIAFLLFRVDPAGTLASAAPAPSTVAAQSSEAIRIARAFGTPVPRTASAPLGTSTEMINPAPAATAVPAAQPFPTPAPNPAAPGPLKSVSPQGTAAQYVADISGTFREVSFYSPSLDRDMAYYIYLPPGYGTEPRRYPVLYMLHGGGGDKDEWPAYGLVNDADQAIVSKDIAPMIIVMPQGDLGYWVNWPNGGPRWGDYVALDLRGQIDSTYRTLPDAAHRAIGGLSMGGAGALQLGFSHPDIFGVVGAHSPALHVDDGSFSTVYGRGQDFAQREPIDLATNASDVDTLKIWIDAGEGDPWLERDVLLGQNLDERGIAHNWSVLPGEHDGDYWIQNLPTYLRFYDSVMNGSGTTA